MKLINLKSQWYTNELEVSKLFTPLKHKKSRGHDGISIEILKSCSPVIEIDLVGSFKYCIKKQYFFPECLKIAKVIPLFKKGDESLSCNYRTLSLLSSLGKVFEKLLYQLMVKFFDKNNLFTPAQYGFRPNYSCAHVQLPN